MKGVKKTIDMAKVERMLSTGLHQAAIARKLGVSRQLLNLKINSKDKNKRRSFEQVLNRIGTLVDKMKIVEDELERLLNIK